MSLFAVSLQKASAVPLSYRWTANPTVFSIRSIALGKPC